MPHQPYNTRIVATFACQTCSKNACQQFTLVFCFPDFTFTLQSSLPSIGASALIHSNKFQLACGSQNICITYCRDKSNQAHTSGYDNLRVTLTLLRAASSILYCSTIVNNLFLLLSHHCALRCWPVNSLSLHLWYPDPSVAITVGPFQPIPIRHFI